MKKIDQDRLLEVKRILEENPLKFPVATVSRELNENTSRVSTYLKGTKPMPDKFYVAFMERFGNNIIPKAEQPENVVIKQEINLTNELVESNKLLAQANNIYAQSNLKLAENMERLTKMAENMERLTKMAESKSDSDSKNLVAVETMKHNLLELLSKLHTKGVKYQSNEEAISELNTLFAEIESR